MTKRFIEGGFNLQYYLTPLDPEVDKFPQYPDLEVVNVSDLKRISSLPKYVFICGDWLAAAFVHRFAELGIQLITYEELDNVKNSEFYLEHLPEIFDVYQMFNDDESRRVFLAFMLGHSSCRVSDFIFDSMPQYFLHGFMPKPGDILIDGGAFDGSSGAMFKKYGCEVYSFELDSKNFERAKDRANRDGFVVENFGLGEHSKQVEYFPNNYGSAVGNYYVSEDQKRTAQLISIDEYVQDKNLPRIDFVKLDIEGSELATLKGAALSIARWKPRLAISAYHRPEDVFTLAKFLKSIRPDYEFAFRHYPTSYDNEPDLFGAVGKVFLETFDLPLKLPYFYESVLYAR
ncbi:MAG: FkbM family methyltransferase [Selenomonadaceae bacterium]|nr:FkbM family methyltransferase [Selenomonadaceae bacterium]